MMHNPSIYYHIFCHDGWKDMFQEQLLKIVSSGLLYECRSLCFSVVGYTEDDLKWINGVSSNIENSRVHAVDSSMWHLQERATLLNMHRECGSDRDGDWPILYMHMKGLTRRGYNSDMWRIYMDHFNISEWRRAVKKLQEGFLAYGVNLRDDTEEHFHKKYLHYSGNMWWSRASHIRSLNTDFIKDQSTWLSRWNSEFWIGTNGDRERFFCIHESGVDHYKEPYEVCNYISLKRLEI